MLLTSMVGNANGYIRRNAAPGDVDNVGTLNCPARLKSLASQRLVPC